MPAINRANCLNSVSLGLTGDNALRENGRHHHFAGSLSAKPFHGLRCRSHHSVIQCALVPQSAP